MTGRKPNLRRAVERIYAAGAHTIQCDKASILMARAADAALSREQARRQHPELAHHLDVCVDCSAEFEILLTLAALDPDRPPLPTPPRPGSRRSPLHAFVTAVRDVRFPGFAPQAAAALARGADLDVDPVTVVLGANQVQIELDVGINEENSALRDLFCTVTAEDAQLAERLEGASAWLLGATDGPVVGEGVLDDLGDVAFTALQPNQPYTMQLAVAGAGFAVSEIVLP